jgi:CBS domain-containing protein
MLDHGIRHLPVLSPGRRLLGVLDDVDLLANEQRAPFRLHASIARASDANDLVQAASDLREMVIALFDAGLPSAAISRAITSIHDAATRRLIEFAHEDLGRPPVTYTWLATGSFGRFEAFPSSDVDCALAWDGPDDDAELRRAFAALAQRVLDGLSACGLPAGHEHRDRHEPAVRPLDRGVGAATSWVEDPDRNRGLLLLSVVVESDPVWGITGAPSIWHGSSPTPRIGSSCCEGSPLPRSRCARPPASSGTSFSTRAVSAAECSTSSAGDSCRSRRWRAGAAWSPA